MTTYVALLRGIMPMNPNMRNEKLREVFESLGFMNVRTVISSGNVLFETDLKDAAKLEAMVEEALPEKLGFFCTTIIRSKEDLTALIKKDPFTGKEHSRTAYLNVTFLKRLTKTDIAFPYRVEGREYLLVGMYERAICSIIDLTGSKTPDLMVWLEKQFGKEITTRTWKTVLKIHSKM